MRQLLGCKWRTAIFAQFHAILSSFTGLKRHILWIVFLVQSWALWNIRNKLIIEKKVMNHPANIIYKIVILQLWSLKLRAIEKEGLNWMAQELRVLYAAMKRRS
jgi:hypothetical protein